MIFPPINIDCFEEIYHEIILKLSLDNFLNIISYRKNCSLKHKNCVNTCIEQCLAEYALIDNLAAPKVIYNSSDESQQSDSAYNSVDSINFELNPYLEQNMLPITYGKFTRYNLLSIIDLFLMIHILECFLKPGFMMTRRITEKSTMIQKK